MALSLLSQQSSSSCIPYTSPCVWCRSSRSLLPLTEQKFRNIRTCFSRVITSHPSGLTTEGVVRLRTCCDERLWCSLPTRYYHWLLFSYLQSVIRKVNEVGLKTVY